MKAILKAAPAAIVIAHDPHLRRVSLSREAREMLRAPPQAQSPADGLSSDQAARLKVFQAGKELDLSELPVQQAARGVEVRGVELGVVLQDGLSRQFYGSATPLLDERGVPAGAIGVFVDVTKLKQSNEALAAKVRELIRSNIELERFASVVSHDLRSPLLSLTGCAEELCEAHMKSLSTEGRELVGHIHDSAFHMARLIKSLLKSAAAEPGKLEVAECDVNLILRRSVDLLQVALRTAGGKVTSDHLPVVLGNETQLCQLLQNLIENAIKYCKDVLPQIHISSRRQSDSWCISVQDNGIGIDPKDFNSIFDPFKQLRPDPTQYTGLGLGLATCKKIVERHGGRIWVESQPGRGATFFFSIPRSGSCDSESTTMGQDSDEQSTSGNMEPRSVRAVDQEAPVVHSECTMTDSVAAGAIESGGL